MTTRASAALLLLLSLLLATSASFAKDKEVRAADGAVLSVAHAQFLEDVEWLISRAERKAFLALKADYQRDGFIRRFWEARDPYPETAANEFQVQWLRRLEQAFEQYGTKYDDRFRMFVLHGAPTELRTSECGLLMWPLEIWRYTEGDNLPRGMTLVFYQRAASGPYALWQPQNGVSVLRAVPMDSAGERTTEDVVAFERDLRKCVGDYEWLLGAFRSVRVQDQMGMTRLTENKPQVRDSEWLQSFRADSTELKPGTETLAGKLTLAYPETDRGRTVVQGVVEIVGAEPGDFDGQHAVDLRLVGEILREEALFENFRYRYAIPVAAGVSEVATDAGTTASPLPKPTTAPATPTPLPAVALAFERQLRPGHYRLILRAEDLRSGKAWREVRDFEVPRIELRSDAAEPERLAAAASILKPEQPTIEIVSADEAPMSVGAARYEAQLAGFSTARPVGSVVFFLDGKRMLERVRPPYSVDLRLDDVPRTHRVRVVALDKAGAEIAAAERLINPKKQLFVVRLDTPARSGGSLRLTAAVDVPDSEVIERLEFRLNGRLVAEVAQEPFVATVAYKPEDEHDFVTATAYLADGHAAEDVRWVVAPENEERVDVRWVQLAVAVEDAARRPVAGLTETDFSLFEDGAPRELLRFETAADAPLQVLLAVDTSASMTKTMDEVRSAALGFLRSALQPRDRAAVLTFADRAVLATELTADEEALKRALATLSADRGTALWDAMIQALVYLQGARGQGAVILLSDGKDQTSRFTFDQVLEMAQRASIGVYTIGVRVGLDPSSRRNLCKLAEGTGGRCFFAGDGATLAEAYREIENDLRRRYILTFEADSSPTAAARGFHRLEVKVKDPKLRARSSLGYWP